MTIHAKAITYSGKYDVMKKSLLTLTLLVFSLSIVAQQRTDINNAAAAKMLAGKHKLSLQWISWDYFGTATVKNTHGAYSIKGEQKGQGNTDFVTIDGSITRIDAKEFTFDGKIVLQISHINGGQPCERKGEFTFKITGKRKYWRLMQMDNPCDEVTDYVDIYFR